MSGHAFRTYAIVVSLLAVIFVVSWYTESLRMFGLGDQKASVSTLVAEFHGTTNASSTRSATQHEVSNAAMNGTSAPPILWPIQVMNDYKRQHSATALANDPDPERKFAIVYYYCPNRAGNILHNLFTSVAWAMIHNRTLLYLYDTDFGHRNTEDECQDVLRRADWIPSWEEWAPRLQLEDPVPVPVDGSRSVQYDQQHQVVIFPQIKDVMSKHTTLFRNEWRDDPSHKREYWEYIRGMGEGAKRRTTLLWYYGVDFLWGMLFREIFTVHVSVDNPFQPSKDEYHDVVSLALHSRHTVVGDDGTFITDEIKCLTKLLPKTPTKEICVVYLMSDRPATVHKLMAWLEARNCSGVTANPADEDEKTVPTVIREEMGPNQGIGYIRDLQLSSAARSGIVGDFRRSSFMLLVELIEYGRRIDDWNNGRQSPDTIPRCDLPERHGKGYDYGPGTPTFRSHWHQPPLLPIQVLEEYKAEHSLSVLESEWPSTANGNNNPVRSFTVGYLPCPLDSLTTDGLHAFLGDFLLAIVSNTTLVWRYDYGGTIDGEESSLDCDRYLQPQESWIPGYDEWSDKLDLGNSTSIHPAIEFGSRARYSNSSSSSPSWVYAALLEKRDRGNLNSSKLEMLCSEGVDFLYGMLLDSAIQFRGSVSSPVASQRKPALDPPSFTLGVHLQSVDDYDEMNDCLEAVLASSASFIGDCQIFLAISEWHGELPRLVGNCSLFVFDNQVGELEDVAVPTGSDPRFFQDLLYTADHARSGFIGNAGSSQSALILERIEYKRRIEAWKQGRIPRVLPDFQTCHTPAQTRDE